MKHFSNYREEVNRDSSESELQQEINRRAYELYALRGYVDGHELDDWLQAEAEVTEAIRGKAA
jgi:hypothetical protein